MDLKLKIESLLPGAWSKVIFLGSIGLSILLYRFFPDLPAKYLPEAETEKFLIRLLSSGSILLLGSVSLIGILIHHNRKLSNSMSNLKLKIEEQQKTVDTLSKTAYDVLKHNRQPQFVPKFGVLWDKNKEPYCPSCTVLLSNYQSFVHDLTGKTEYFFRCLKCKQVVHLKDGDNPISLDDARKRI